jgi:phosphoenolpyruvate-protein phosphotransferase (PTS system enzyme I)
VKSFSQIFKEADNKLTGIAAAPGIEIGTIYLFNKEQLKVKDGFISDPVEAIKNFEEAIAKSKKELTKIFSIAREKVDDQRATIFEAQMMILDDPILTDNIVSRIEKELREPEFIVNDEINKYLQLMLKSGESYMQERAHDIDDIKHRIIRNLQKKRWQSKIPLNSIVVTDSLTPADILLLSRSNTKAFITDHGGITSHAAIISRSLNIPAIVGTHNATQKINDGDTVIVDGFHGYILVNPNEDQLVFFRKKVERLQALQKELEELRDTPAVTCDGVEISLSANVDVTGEIDLVMTSGAKGIGLYRTEQILDELGEFPTEDEQHRIYSNLALRVYPECLTIRAFDIGGDKFKFLDYKEPNPFLGLRGIRILLEQPLLFKQQIRAVLRASVNKNIQFMLPMLTTIKELEQSKSIIEECKKELKKEGISFDKGIKIGIMIEVPSAAVMTYDFAQRVDFISIGTNDLIQYLMAVDRGNDLVSELYQEFNPSVIKTIKHIIVGAERAGKPVSICGEMAADTLAIPLLIGLGLRSLSMSPATITYAKRIIGYCDCRKTAEMAEECLSYISEDEIISRIQKFFSDNNITRTRNII